MPHRLRLIIIVALTTLLVILTGMAAWLITQGPSGLARLSGSGAGTESSSGTALVGGPFTLVNQDGETWTEKNLEGRHTVIFFGYTYCPDVCPLTLQNVAVALEELGPVAQSFLPVFVTVDPERDTPERMKEYVGWFDERIVGLTGSREQVEAAMRAYRVYGKKVEDDTRPAGEYLVDHSSVVYVMGPDGAFLRHFSHTTPPEEMAAGLLESLS
ncbi:MAG: SCO family protein [Pseudomonadota bacterium]